MATMALVGAVPGRPAMTDPRLPFVDRVLLPPVLLPDDIAVVLDLPSERAARELIVRHGVPHIRLGGRIYVRAAALLAFLEGREQVAPTEEAAKAKAEEDLRAIAPTLKERQGRKKAARRRKESP